MRAYMEQWHMFPSTDGLILCAVSGGKDSMCLLHRLKCLSAQMDFTVAAAHFNHRLRGENADRDEAFVRAWCEKEQIPFYAGRGDVRAAAAANGWTVEEAARHLRYNFLEETADKIGAEKIATAHHAADQAETVLMNLTRGTGPEGLCGIRPVRGRLIRPLLRTTPDEIEAYLEKYQIPHVEDETNADTVMTRNRLRQLVIPQLRTINSAFDEAVGRTAEILRREDDFLNELAGGYLDQTGVSCRKLLNAPEALRPRIIRLAIDRLPVGKKDFTARHVEQLLRLAAEGKSGDRLSLPQRVTARRIKDLLVLELVKMPPAETVLSEKETTWGEFTITCRKSYLNFCEKRDSILLNCGKMKPYVSVRSWRGDDRLQLPGAKGSRSLKRLFSDAGIAGEERERIPVLCMDGRIAAVYGIGVDEEFTGGEDTTIAIEIHKGKGD